MIHKLKPYPTYKNSGLPWLEEVPAHWELRRIRNAAEMCVSNVDKQASVEEVPVRLCNYVDVYKHDRIHSEMLFMRGTASPDEIARFRLERGDVLITKDSETWDDIGVPAFVEQSADDLICGYHLAILRPFRDRLDGEYLLRAMQSTAVSYQFHVAANGVTRYGLSHAAIKSIWLPLPPLREQAAIGRFLNHADRRIRRFILAKQKMIKLLEEQKQTIIHCAVTRGLDPNVRLKPSGVEWIGSIPSTWSVQRTKNLFRLRTQKSGDSHGLDLLSIYTHIGVRPRKDLEERGNKATTTDDYWIVRKGDIIVNKLLAWMGAVGVSSYDGVTSPAYDILMPIQGLVPQFYHHLFRTKLYLQQFKQRSRGIMDMRLRLYFDQLGQIPLVVPPLEEQSAIVAFYIDATADLDRTIGIAEREISLLREYRARLIADVVTGKLDVREAAPILPDEREESELPLAGSELGEEPDVDFSDGDAEVEE